MDKERFRQLLYMICQDCHCHDKSDPYCTLIEVFLSSHSQDPRFIIQTKCVEKFKYDKGKELNREISWKEAHMMWIDEGYANIFADLYKEDMFIETLYKQIIDYKRNMMGVF